MKKISLLRPAFWLATCLLLAPSTAQAQTQFSVEGFRPSPHGDSMFSVESGAIDKSYSLRVGLFGDYFAHALEVTFSNGQPNQVLNRHRVDGHLFVAATFLDHLSVAIAFPFTLYQRGKFTNFAGLDESDTSAGDLRFEVKGGLLDQARHHLDLALLVMMSVPSGNELTFAGDRSITLSGELDVSRRFGPLRTALNLGAMYRQATAFLGTRIGPEMYARFGLGFDIARVVEKVPLEIIAEIVVRTTTETPFATNGLTPVEILAGAKWAISPAFALNAGGGFGLTSGYSAPLARAFLGLVWTPLLGYECEKDPEPRPEPKAEPQPEPQPAPQPEPKAEPQPEPQPAPQPEPKPEPQPEPATQPEPRAEPAPTPKPAPVEAARPTYELASDGAFVERLAFEKNSAKLSASSNTSLDRIAKWMKEDPKLKLLIEGHTDIRGTDSLNKNLSNARATAVKEALEKRGVDKRRLRAVGLGSTQPLIEGDDDGANEKNRRVVFRPE